MTKVNVTFGRPEDYFGLELDTPSQLDWDRHKEAEDANEDQTLIDMLWDAFLQQFERQVRLMGGNRGYVEEVYESDD